MLQYWVNHNVDKFVQINKKTKQGGGNVPNLLASPGIWLLAGVSLVVSAFMLTCKWFPVVMLEKTKGTTVPENKE